MVNSGRHLKKGFDPPVNTHIAHAFLLNCRKLADFFSCGGEKDDVIAGHYVSTVSFDLPVSKKWRSSEQAIGSYLL